MGKSSREKGKRGERQAAKALATHLGVEARRGVQYAGGPNSPDVHHNLPGVHFEVKYYKGPFGWKAALGQLFLDAGSAVPVLVYRRNGRPWWIAVPDNRITELCRLLLAFWHTPGRQYRGHSCGAEVYKDAPGLRWEWEPRGRFEWYSRIDQLLERARGEVPVLEADRAGHRLACMPLDRTAEFVRIQAALWGGAREGAGQ